MTPRRAPKRRRAGIAVLAGWLFADLLLVLAVVSMADRPDPIEAHPKSPHKPSPTASPKPTAPVSLDPNPRDFRVHGSDGKSLAVQIRNATAHWKDRKAALVEVFGGTANGTGYARHVIGTLGAARGDMFGRRTVTKPYIDMSRAAQTATVRIFFFTAPRA